MAIRYKVERIATGENLHFEEGEVLETTRFDTKEEALAEVANDAHTAISSVKTGGLPAIPYYSQIHEEYVDTRTPQEILDALRQQAEWAQNDRDCNWVMYDRLADIINLADDLQKKLVE